MIIGRGMEDLERLSLKIEEFIREQVERFRKNGVILGLSGGIDSSVVAFLAVRALGKGRVFGLIMPDKESSPQNIEDARLVARILGIKVKEIDITPILESIGVYRLAPARILKNKELLLGILNLYRRERGVRMLHSLGVLGLETPDKISQIATARMLPKLRIRSLLLYYYGVQKNLLVCGTTNKTEYMLGHYDKYGDGACDIEPIRIFYKTEVFELAKFLGVPERIIKKPPTHDLFAGFILTDEEMMGMGFEVVDSILKGLEEGKSEEEISRELKIDLSIIEEVKRAVKNQEINRSMPLSPQL
jgi:NAD+ synthase